MGNRIKVTKDLTGQKFGRLTVLEQADDFVSSGGNKVSGWLCKCDCGNEVRVRGASLLNGTTKSCGCYALSPESKNTKNTIHLFKKEILVKVMIIRVQSFCLIGKIMMP